MRRARRDPEPLVDHGISMNAFFRRRSPAHAPVEISERNDIRFLHLGGPAVQSAMRVKDPYALDLEYTRAMMAFLLFQRAPKDIALIGLGGGSIAKFIHRHLPTSRLTALEINPEVVAAARAFFYLPQNDARLNVITGDGAAFVHENPASQDVLLVDGYDAKRIVDALASAEFYRACKAMLRPGGVALFNLWGSDEHFPRYFDRLSRAFGEHVLQLPAEKKANIVVLAFRKPLPDTTFEQLSAAAGRLEMEIGLEFDAFLVRMGACNPCSDDAFIV
jgi:spermidine synthase